jgi:hypothetical protein
MFTCIAGELSFTLRRKLRASPWRSAVPWREPTPCATGVRGARGEIVVAYPKPGKVRRPPPEPVSIQCAEKTLRPAKIRIRAAQSQVYRFRTPSRIVIELEKPDDGPAG